MSSKMPPRVPPNTGIPPANNLPPAPGCQYPEELTGESEHIRGVMRNIYDNLFYLRNATNTPQPLTTNQLQQVEQQIIKQVISQVTNNITQNVTFNSVMLTGTHTFRLAVYGAASQTPGTGFFETDRNVIYIITNPPAPQKWQFAAGCMFGVIAARPTDLGIYDESFLFFASDQLTLYIWSGTTWIAIGGASTGYWTPVSNGIPDNPELVFDSFANVVVVFVATP